MVSGRKPTRAAAASENMAKMRFGNMGSVTSDKMAMYEETPEPKRAT